MIKLEKLYHKNDSDDYVLYDTVEIEGTPLCDVCKELVRIELVRIMLLPYGEKFDVKMIQLFSDNDTIVTLAEWGEYKEGSMRNKGLIKLYDKDYEIAFLNNSTTHRNNSTAYKKRLCIYNILVELEKLGIVAYELGILITNGKVETIRVISDSKDYIRGMVNG